MKTERSELKFQGKSMLSLNTTRLRNGAITCLTIQLWKMLSWKDSSGIWEMICILWI